MRKKIALATLAMLPMAATNVSASGQYGIVNTSSLNVRSGAGTNYTVLFTVKKDERVEIKDTLNGWYKIRTTSGKEGFASSTYISKTNQSNNETTSGNKKKTTDRVNLRSGAGTSYRVITTLNKGEVLEVISESNGWTKVKYDGRIGYVSSQYLENVGSSSNNTQTTTKIVDTDILNVRSGPSTSNSIVGKLKKGEKVNVISESNGWSKINFNGKEAYTSSMYLKSQNQGSTPSTPEAPSTPETTKETKVVNTSSLNVRSGAGTNYSKIGSLKSGDKVEVISESNGWSKIKFNGSYGYVSSEYLSKISTSTPDVKPETPSTPETTKETKEVNTSSLNVRSGPGTTYSKIGSLKLKDKVDVVSENNGWSKVKFSGKDGYVSSEYLSEVGSNTETPAPPVVGGDSVEVINGATVHNKGLSYSLSSHVQKQIDVAKNVIDSSKPRTTEDITNPRIAQARAFINADRSDLEYFLNPKNFRNSKKGMLQFLRIDSYKGGITSSELNSYLNSQKLSSSGTNVFHNQGQAFIDAAKKYDIDLVYLVAHSMWETGYGASTLAQGQTLTSYQGKPLDKPVKVYNFFGIGAFDGTANLSGAEAAYKNGWTSVEATIEGSAKWIANNYIKSQAHNQNTIYKMKFNYDNPRHQYATDVNWANGISGIMNKIIGMYDTASNLKFEVPNYNGK